MGVKISLGTYRMFFVDGESRSACPISAKANALLLQAARTFTVAAGQRSRRPRIWRAQRNSESKRFEHYKSSPTNMPET